MHISGVKNVGGSQSLVSLLTFARGKPLTKVALVGKLSWHTGEEQTAPKFCNCAVVSFMHNLGLKVLLSSHTKLSWKELLVFVDLGSVVCSYAQFCTYVVHTTTRTKQETRKPVLNYEAKAKCSISGTYEVGWLIPKPTQQNFAITHGPFHGT